MKFQSYIALSDIQIASNRQRRVFPPKELNELVESIKQHGLFHALGLRKENGSLVLVHGERRLRAIQDIYDLGGRIKYDGSEVPEGKVPYTDLGEMSELEREEAELAENIHRSDLTWQERAAATARLATLRTGQADSSQAPRPTVAQISEEVRGSSEGVHHETTRREIIVAKYLDDPEVKAAKSVDEAFKLLKRKEETQRNVALAEQVGRTFTADLHRAYNEDALDWLVKCPAEQFDVILTDTPYGMGADEFGDSGGRAIGAHGYTDDAASFTRILSICQTELFRIAKPQAHLYWFCDIDQFHNAREAFTACGWWVHRTPLVWHKPSASRVPWPEHGPQRKYELILYAVKGKRPVTKIFPDVISINPDENLGHAAQKPIALFEDLLRRSVRAGDSVLDPFAGSGTIFPAAHRVKCKAVGVERDPGAYGIALKRLEALKAAPELEGL